MTRLRFLLPALALLGVIAPVSCGDDEKLDETGTKTPDAGSDAPIVQPDAGNDGPVGPTLRTVETRSRFGTLDLNNYLLDGDFEYSGMDALQYPWFGAEHDWIVTGARCRTGLRCMEVPYGQYAIGVFVWPDSGSIDVEYYAKPRGTGTCSDEVGAVLIPLGDYNGAPSTNMSVSAQDPDPGPDGWCHVTRNYAVPSDTGNTFWALLLTPRQDASDAVLFDDAAIRKPTGGGSALSSSGSAQLAPDLKKMVARARTDFARRPPVPPRTDGTTVKNRTGRRSSR
jgi:hypothetical protein